MTKRVKLEQEKKCGKGCFKVKNGLYILHLKGSYYDIGYQHGILLTDWCKANLRATINLAKEQKIDLTILRKNWEVIKKFIPRNSLDEMKGLSDSLEMSINEIGMIWIVGETLYSRCCGASLWKNATKNHKLIHIRSYDVPYIVRDPISNEIIQEKSILIISEPDAGYAFMYPTMAGFVCHGGINEKGIAVSYTWSWNNERKIKGIPVTIRLNNALTCAASAKEVIEILRENRTCGYNFIISDGNKRKGYILEQTTNYSIINEWDNPNESNNPFWNIENCVRRTNFFINTLTAKTQRNKYKPNGIENFINMLMGFNYLGNVLPIFFTWRHYRTLSNEIEKNYSNIDLDCAVSFIRNIYCGKTDPFLAISQKLSKRRYSPMHQWVACPETGDMLLSFANSKNSAEKNDIYRCNLFNFINRNKS
jgi:predicted choloylglycine hydrolase